MTQGVPYKNSKSCSNGASTSITIVLPSSGFLTAASVASGNSTNHSPVEADLYVEFAGPGAGAVRLQGGSVARGGRANKVFWTGRLPLYELGSNTLNASIRNDTGAAVIISLECMVDTL